MQLHRIFKPEFKARVVMQLLTGVKSAAQLCREHSLSDQLLSNWKKQFLDKARAAFATTGATSAEQERIAELERLVGRLTLELEAAKKVLPLAPSRAEKRAVIAQLATPYPVTLLCALLPVSRSSYYYAARAPEETTVRQALEKLAAEFPTSGSRRLTAQLRRAPFRLLVNRKRVQRLMRELGLQVRTRRVAVRTTNSRHSLPRYPNLMQEREITQPDEVWVADITYIRLRHEFLYLAVVMDVYTRVIRGWQRGVGLGAELALGALEKALQHGTPQIHHSDQGVQYASTVYTARLLEVGAQLSRAEVGESAQNGYAERVIRTLKEEEVTLNDYADLADAERNLARFIDDVYRYQRIHSSLHYQTPAEYEAAWQAAAGTRRRSVANETALQRATARRQEPAV